LRASQAFTAGAVASAALLAAGAVGAANTPYFPGDVAVERWIQDVPFGVLSRVMDLTNAIAAERETMLAIVLAVVIGVVRWRAGVLVSLGIPAVDAENYLKELVRRPRPSGALVQIREHDAGFSFPSGHTCFYAWLSILLLVAVWPWLPRRARPFAIAAGCVLVLIACVGRVWVGAHWPSDALGGALFGVVWAWLAWIVWRRATRESSPRPEQPATS